MATPIETLRGSHYEMGVQHGRLHRHVIHAVAHNTIRHDFEQDDAELDELLSPMVALVEKIAPWVFEELQGIAEGSGVEYGVIRRMHFRVWNMVPRKPSPTAGCTGIGIVCEDGGILVGGTLDDPRAPYHLIRRHPDKGIPHVMVMWAGTSWGHNGMNAEGLCVAQSSLGGYSPAPSGYDATAGRIGSLQTRLLLETCSTVEEALAHLRRVRSESSLVIGDRKGDLVAVQCLGGFEPAVQRPEDHSNMVFNTNHVHMKDLVAKLAEAGSTPDVPEHTRVRFETLVEERASARPRTLEFLLSLLRSHRGYPHSICRDSMAFATYGIPRAEPAVFHVADRPACRSEFAPYPVLPEG